MLIFEAVRRGLMPKITRRLRDDERKMITSGTIFVFDEVESSIKRWTDGMIWSPSRILNNFLVYREVEKKDPKPAPDQPAFSTSNAAMMHGSSFAGSTGLDPSHSSVRSVPLTLMPNAIESDAPAMQYKQEGGNYASLHSGGSSSNAVYAGHDGFFANHGQQHPSAYARGHAQAAGMVGLMDDAAAASSSNAKREAELDRTIVGSLTSSYPFVRDGLCKKTISIQVEGSTQHLISYYRVDDVHNQRLTIPSNLPEIAALCISPIFLNKSNFRYPPIVEIGPDGMPRYVAESTDASMRASGHVSSGNESYSSGSEARHEGMGRSSSRSMTMYTPSEAVEAASFDLYSHRHPHQIGGDGILPMSATLPMSTASAQSRNRRLSDAPRRRANSRYEPYQQPTTFGNGIMTPLPYPQGPAMDHNPISPPGRRALLGQSRGYVEAEPFYASEQASFGMPRQDAGFFGMNPAEHGSNQGSGAHMGQLGQQANSAEEFQQQGRPQPSFHASHLMPIVPSQPGRDHTGYLGESNLMHVRAELMGVKQETSDIFHFSSRMGRGSWDSNQPSHAAPFMHNVQQPPATSQGLTAISVHSPVNLGGPVYGRFAGSPPNTSSSHDSRHSYVDNVQAPTTGRIEELADGGRPPTASRLEDASYLSRPLSRAEEGGYVGDLDSAGVVRAAPVDALQVHSDPTTPYPHAHRTLQSHAGDAAAGLDSYGRLAGEAQGSSTLYAHPATHLSQGHAHLQRQPVDRQGQDAHNTTHAYMHHDPGMAMPHDAQSRPSNAAQERSRSAPGEEQAFPSRPGTSQGDAFHHQYRDGHGGQDTADGQVTDGLGLERVLLTRPPS